MSQYKVLVDDNFHYQDEDKRYELGTYSTVEEALAACRKLVDDWLEQHYRPGMTADDLYQHYTSFGQDPYVVPPSEVPGAVIFSAWEYARVRAEAICGERTDPQLS